MNFSELCLCVIIGLLIDALLGESRRFHPLVGFGYIASKLENYLNHGDHLITKGSLAWVLAVLPLCFAVCAFFYLCTLPIFAEIIVGSFIVYLGIARRSLLEHSEAVATALKKDLHSGRVAVGMIVSRETSEMDTRSICNAAIESTLENCNDSVIAPIFWFLAFGPAALVLYRLSNTLDAMWGYKNKRYLKFGKASARIDDLLNYIPARICALLFCFSKNAKQSILAWQQQAKHCASPNGGPVMCTGAAALGLQLGGPAIYHGKKVEKTVMGYGLPATNEDITRANQFVNRRIVFLTIILACLALLIR
ncbi:adenosylcobinamide-phosphate synthase CbiB [uncultured Pseudoteredinibacter sp.]|uniref:adenosylcobinamide-phosphate synthase CbiB n=1 Tax=uncultured Pseudoteredinibacter sp. TaxID=1641701 RepID=UPI002638B819|nr:adenosylcobinamide-phosphate synthase CbiB [uncultured Pseudoteredinibacter sp.]